MTDRFPERAEPSAARAPAAGLAPIGASRPTGGITQPLGRSAALSTLWLTGQKWLIRLSGLLTVAILTRLIPPSDFGVVAAASTVAPMVLLLADLGLSTYIIQADHVDTRTLSTAFWFSVSAGLILSAGLAIAAPTIAAAFGVRGSTSILRAMALSVLVTVPAAVPMALLRRRLLFKRLALQGTVATFAAQVVAIVLAFAGAGAWALVIQLLVTQGVAGALAWQAVAWTPRLEFDPAVFRRMARFGGPVVAVDILGTTRGMLEAAIVSNALGVAALGYMSIAQRLVQVVQDLGAAALVPVSTVIFAKVRDTTERLRTGYLRALKIGYAAVAPLLTFVAVAAPTIIPLVFGPGWSASAPVARALSIAAILVLGAMVDNGLHYGVGAPGRWFAYELGIDALIVATTFFLAPYGLVWVAIGFVVASFVATCVRWVLVGRLIEYPVPSLAAVFLVSMIPVVMSAAAGLLVQEATTGLSRILGIVVVGSTVVFTHVVTVRIISRPVLADVFALLPIPQRIAGLRRLV